MHIHRCLPNAKLLAALPCSKLNRTDHVCILKLAFCNCSFAGALDYVEIRCNRGKQRKKNAVCGASLSLRLLFQQKAVKTVDRRIHPNRANQRRTSRKFQIVISISKSLGELKTHEFEVSNHIGPVAVVNNEVRLAASLRKVPVNALNMVAIDADLTRDLEQKKNALSIVTVGLPLSLFSCQADGYSACSVRSRTEPVGKPSENNGGRHRSYSSYRSPSIPPNVTTFSKWPALVDPIKNAHVPPPFWMDQNFAMGPCVKGARHA